MNISKALSAAANVTVIVVVAVYFWRTAGPGAGQQSLRDRSVPIEISQDEWARLTTGGSRLGDVAASAVIVEFLDYQCPYCSRVSPIVERYARSHPDEAIVIRHYPLAMHAAADGAARAAICAEAQGMFSRMHATLFEREDWQTNHDWLGLAEDVGIPDLTEFDRCLRSVETRARLEADRALATEFGVRATPTFVSRHSIVEGSLDHWTLSALASGRSAR